MGRIREIAVSSTNPGAGKLWLKPKATGGYDIYAMENGSWAKVSSGSAGGGSGMTDEEKRAIEAKIAAAQASAETAQSTANEANTAAASAVSVAEEALDAVKSMEGLTSIAADKVTLSSDNENLSSTDNVKAALEKIAAKVWYSKIAIQGLAVTAGGKNGTYEVGTTVAAPTLTWKTTKTPVKTVCDGKTLTATATTYTAAADITANKTITVTVTESEGGTASSSLSWAFAYAVYTGMATEPASFTQEWVKSTLGGKTLKTSAAGSYTMKGSTDKYWWLVAPSAWTVSFSTSLGAGGAEKAGTVTGFVNDAGKAVPMTVYRASKIQGGDMTITVK